jgi:RNA polymerase subunit RPABC4/transcription elongation factor Spt4
MAKCPNCRKEVPEEQESCPHCGQDFNEPSVEKKPHCGTPHS